MLALSLSLYFMNTSLQTANTASMATREITAAIRKSFTSAALPSSDMMSHSSSEKTQNEEIISAGWQTYKSILLRARFEPPSTSLIFLRT